MSWNHMIIAFGDTPVPYGETKEKIKECLDLMHGTLQKEIIEAQDFDL